MENNNVQDTLKKIEKKGSIYGLESITKLLELLGNPQNEMNVIHVAGTNGKGSVIAFLNKILMQAGYCTGCYTSPAVFAKTESFRVNEEQITESEYESFLAKVLAACKDIEAEELRHPSVFEIETALAFLVFKEKNCDFVLLETGLGGDMDATNVVEKPACVVFTSISRDHMHLLGDTLEEIAGHKAGIIKENVPVVSAKQMRSVEAVLRKRAEEKNTEVSVRDEYELIDHISDFVPVSQDRECFNEFDCESHNTCGQYFKCGESDHIYNIQLLGEHQIENAAVVLKTVHVLRQQGYQITEDAVVTGLANTKWHGRFSCLHSKPDIYMDGAHNEAASLVLAEAVKKYMGSKRKIMIAGMLADKEYEKVMKNVGVLADKLITVTPPVERGLPAEVLAEACLKNGIEAHVGGDIRSALVMLKEELKEDDALLIFGSLSFLKEAEECVKEMFD